VKTCLTRVIRVPSPHRGDAHPRHESGLLVVA